MQQGFPRRFLVDVVRVAGALLLILLASCQPERQWDDATGARKAKGVGKWFEDSWVSAPWGSIRLLSTAGDSVSGSSADGQIQIRGAVVRHRIDVEISWGEGGVRTGYFYLIPDTDSLFVGLRGLNGAWERFFPMVRERGAESL
jgi:hypothetical protein